ncbi:hypothetical protein [Streptomyces sp. 6N223]|uniref:hypothetical protein n=1 Tax=Streptomyces sp. 6N223 TaxID=3457412 RepID=UPI003FD09735
MSPVAHDTAPPDTAHAPSPTAGRTPAYATVTDDDSRRHAALAVQRALDRRDNGGAFGH